MRQYAVRRQQKNGELLGIISTTDGGHLEPCTAWTMPPSGSAFATQNMVFVASSLITRTTFAASNGWGMACMGITFRRRLRNAVVLKPADDNGSILSRWSRITSALFGDKTWHIGETMSASRQSFALANQQRSFGQQHWRIRDDGIIERSRSLEPWQAITTQPTELWVKRDASGMLQRNTAGNSSHPNGWIRRRPV